MKFPFNKDIDYATEMKKLKRDEGRAKMRVLDKTDNTTWTDTNRRIRDSNLDHVVVSNTVNVTRWLYNDGSEGEVEVHGWNAFKNGSAGWKSFVKNVSDHCSLYFEVN